VMSPITVLQALLREKLNVYDKSVIKILHRRRDAWILNKCLHEFPPKS